MLVAGGLNLTMGTAMFIYNTWKLRSTMNMHGLTSAVHCCMALLHMALWLIAIGVFLGYVEESEEEMSKAILEERQCDA